MAIKIEDMLREIGLELEEPMIKILKVLEKKKNIPEEDIAKKLKLKINETRKLLYRLYEKRLAVYEKKSDPKKKWWYLYYWSLDRDRIEELFLEYKRKQLERKRQELEAEEKFAFECQNCKAKYLYEDALETEFTCTACGSVLEQSKPTPVVKKLRAEIELLEVDLAKTEAKLSAAKPKAKAKGKGK